jgi:hypothetical protein
MGGTLKKMHKNDSVTRGYTFDDSTSFQNKQSFGWTQKWRSYEGSKIAVRPAD